MNLQTQGQKSRDVAWRRRDDSALGALLIYAQPSQVATWQAGGGLAAGAAALARVEGLQGLHGLVERVAQLGWTAREDGVRRRPTLILRRRVVFLHVHINPLATRLEARRKNFLLVGPRASRWRVSLRAPEIRDLARVRGPAPKEFERGWFLATARRRLSDPFLVSNE